MEGKTGSVKRVRKKPGVGRTEEKIFGKEEKKFQFQGVILFAKALAEW